MLEFIRFINKFNPVAPRFYCGRQALFPRYEASGPAGWNTQKAASYLGASQHR